MPDFALRSSGAVLVAAAVLLGTAIVTLSFRPVIGQPFSPGVSLLLLLASIALLLSAPALYARQASAAGWLGLAGYALLQAGFVLLTVLAATPLLYPALRVAPVEHPVVFILGIALTLGLLLTGLATVRAGVFPRWAGVLLLAAMAGFFFDFFVAEFLPPLAGQIGSAFFGVLLALALAGIGVALWVGRPAPLS
jgi:hypothetical protein